MTEYKCGSAKSCKYGDMCKPNFNIGACSHYKAEEPQTNEEWFCQLSTEEKAKFLEMICYSAWGDKNSRFKDMADYTDWMEWLKQPHTTKE